MRITWFRHSTVFELNMPELNIRKIKPDCFQIHKHVKYVLSVVFQDYFKCMLLLQHGFINVNITFLIMFSL